MIKPTQYNEAFGILAQFIDKDSAGVVMNYVTESIALEENDFRVHKIYMKAVMREMKSIINVLKYHQNVNNTQLEFLYVDFNNHGQVPRAVCKNTSYNETVLAIYNIMDKPNHKYKSQYEIALAMYNIIVRSAKKDRTWASSPATVQLMQTRARLHIDTLKEQPQYAPEIFA